MELLRKLKVRKKINFVIPIINNHRKLKNPLSLGMFYYLAWSRIANIKYKLVYWSCHLFSSIFLQTAFTCPIYQFLTKTVTCTYFKTLCSDINLQSQVFKSVVTEVAFLKRFKTSCHFCISSYPPECSCRNNAYLSLFIFFLSNNTYFPLKSLYQDPPNRRATWTSCTANGPYLLNQPQRIYNMTLITYCSPISELLI